MLTTILINLPDSRCRVTGQSEQASQASLKGPVRQFPTRGNPSAYTTPPFAPGGLQLVNMYDGHSPFARSQLEITPDSKTIQSHRKFWSHESRTVAPDFAVLFSCFFF